MATRPRHTRLDEIANLDEQNAWLTSPAIEGASPIREPPELVDDPYDDRLRQLIGSDEWLYFATFLRAYIEDAIFKPFETERRWWKLRWEITLAERGAAARVNIWRQYVLVIDFRADPIDNMIKAHGLVYIDAETQQAAENSGYQLASWFEIQAATYEGKPLAGNKRRQVALRITAAPLDELEKLFNSDWMLAAARTLNLDLMRGGVLAFGWSQFHVPKLVSAIFAEDLSARRFGASTVEPPIGQTTESTNAFADAETEYERVVWLRKNQERFANPVKQYWHGRCAVTGIEAPRLLEACHIKPFSKSGERERLNPFNGLYLAAHVHTAFDASLIGISPDGHVRFSGRLSKADRQKMNLDEGLKIEVTDEHRPFLEYRYSEYLKAQK